MASFKARLNRRAKQVQENSNEVIKQVAATIAQTVIFATPVDTGHARANWLAGIGTEPTAEDPSEDKGGGATFGKVKAELAKRKSEQTIYISNNVPYINRLNDGYSAQAPAMFVEQGINTALAAFKNAKLLED